MDILNDLLIIAKKGLNALVNLFSAAADILIANPTILFIMMFLGLTAGKSLQIGKVFKAKG